MAWIASSALEPHEEAVRGGKKRVPSFKMDLHSMLASGGSGLLYCHHCIQESL